MPEGFDVLPSRADVLRRNKDAGFADNKAFALWLDDGVGALIDKVRELGMERIPLLSSPPIMARGDTAKRRCTILDCVCPWFFNGPAALSRLAI